MVTITYNAQNYILTKHIEHKEENLIKIRLVHEDGMGEGIWAWISDEDKKDYDADVYDPDYSRVAVLANTSLIGAPWGSYVPYRLNGDERPESICDLVIDFDLDEPVFSEDALKSKAEMENKQD